MYSIPESSAGGTELSACLELFLTTVSAMTMMTALRYPVRSMMTARHRRMMQPYGRRRWHRTHPWRRRRVMDHDRLDRSCGNDFLRYYHLRLRHDFLRYYHRARRSEQGVHQTDDSACQIKSVIPLAVMVMRSVRCCHSCRNCHGHCQRCSGQN